MCRAWFEPWFLHLLVVGFQAQFLVRRYDGHQEWYSILNRHLTLGVDQ
jgi:hypothetical protein